MLFVPGRGGKWTLPMSVVFCRTEIIFYSANNAIVPRRTSSAATGRGETLMLAIERRAWRTLIAFATAALLVGCAGGRDTQSSETRHPNLEP